jgi:hypothetical protein
MATCQVASGVPEGGMDEVPRRDMALRGNRRLFPSRFPDAGLSDASYSPAFLKIAAVWLSRMRHASAGEICASYQGRRSHPTEPWS